MGERGERGVGGRRRRTESRLWLVAVVTGARVVYRGW